MVGHAYYSVKDVAKEFERTVGQVYNDYLRERIPHPGRYLGRVVFTPEQVEAIRAIYDAQGDRWRRRKKDDQLRSFDAVQQKIQSHYINEKAVRDDRGRELEA